MQILGSITQDEMNQLFQAWAQSKRANNLSDYLAAASDNPMSIEALDTLLQNL